MTGTFLDQNKKTAQTSSCLINRDLLPNSRGRVLFCGFKRHISTIKQAHTCFIFYSKPMKKSFTIICFALTMISSLFASQVYITSGNGSNWENPQSWRLVETGEQPAHAPTSADDVIIRHYLTHETEVGYTHRGNITVESAAVYEIISKTGKTASFEFSGDRLHIRGTLFTSGKVTLSENSSMIISAASMCWIGGDLVLNNTGGLLNQNRACSAFNIAGGLHMETPAAFIVGKGHMAVAKSLTTSWTALADTAASYEEIAARTQVGMAFFRAEDCYDNTPFLNGTDGEGGFEVEWDYFEATGIREAKLEWGTEREPFTLSFSIERSFDGQSFEILGEVTAEGTAQEGAHYTFVDDIPHLTEGAVYYRIRQNTLEGTFTYSAVRQLVAPVAEPLALDIFPNPTADGKVTIKGKGLKQAEPAAVEIRSLTGVLVSSMQVAVEADGTLQLNQQTTLRTGIYLVVLRQQETQQVTRLVVY